jgi:hypothetical protein
MSSVLLFLVCCRAYPPAPPRLTLLLPPPPNYHDDHRHHHHYYSYHHHHHRTVTTTTTTIYHNYHHHHPPPLVRAAVALRDEVLQAYRENDGLRLPQMAKHLMLSEEELVSGFLSSSRCLSISSLLSSLRASPSICRYETRGCVCCDGSCLLQNFTHSFPRSNTHTRSL